MKSNIEKKAMHIAPMIRGDSVDLGCTDVNWGENLHNYLEKYSGKKILTVDKYGTPDVVADLNKDFQNCFDMQFDTIVTSEVIEHLDSPLNFLKRCKMILKDNGRIILTTPNAMSPAEMVGSLFVKHHKKVYTEHLFSWNKHNMIALVDRAGLDIEKFEYISFYWNKNILLKFIAWVFPFLRPNMLVVLKKK